MITSSAVSRSAIRRHYNLLSVFYRLLWGPHIHHGLWSGNESVRQAQVHLVDVLAAEAQIQSAHEVLDIGCGTGGPAIHLAGKLGCRITGVTLSRVQQSWARWTAWRQGLARNTRFLCADAERISLPPARWDVIWSVECTEHFFDKPEFFRQAAAWLRPGGRFALCAWLASSQLQGERDRDLLQAICQGFLCPSLGSREDYAEWLQTAGLRIDCCHDWTERVIRTWQICRRRVRRTGLQWLARVDPEIRRFLESFEAIDAAYRTGAMRYGCFVASRT